MLAHGLLLCSDDAPPAALLGRLPFDLPDFRDRRSSQSYGFSAFVCTYFHFHFHFVDFRSHHPSLEMGVDQNADRDLEQMERLKALLDLLMQIRPYADGMEVTMILKAMDCVAIKIFDIYSGICNGIACFLVGTLRPSANTRKGEDGEEEVAARRWRWGAVGMKILRKAMEQSSQLTAYFEARNMGSEYKTRPCLLHRNVRRVPTTRGWS